MADTNISTQISFSDYNPYAAVGETDLPLVVWSNLKNLSPVDFGEPI